MQRGFVYKVSQVRSGKAGREGRYFRKIHLGGKADLLRVDSEDLNASLHIRPVDENLTIKTASAKEGGIENFRAVRGGEDHDAFARIEAVHFGQKLVEGLFALVVATNRWEGSACTAQRIEFIDKDDCGRVVSCLLEEVSHASSAYADKHFHKF